MHVCMCLHAAGSIYAARCADSSFILAGQLLSGPYLCLPLLRLVLTPGSLRHCSPLLPHSPYIFSRRSREEKEKKMGAGDFEERHWFKLKRSGQPALYFSASLTLTKLSYLLSATLLFIFQHFNTPTSFCLSSCLLFSNAHRDLLKPN